MTVSGIGGGAFVGWVNTPHASATTDVAPPVAAAAPAPRAPQLGARVITMTRAAQSRPAPAVAVRTVSEVTPAPAADHPASAPASGSPAPAPVAVAPPATASPAATASVTAAGTDGPDSCAAALAYLAANAAPGFTFECPGYALGHQAMTCVNVAGVCAGERLIAISTVCPASYMNEAHNSWILAGYRQGSIDPYGYCH